MIDQALAWVDRRFAVFPLKPRDKIPLGALVPHGAKDASRDLAVIRDWWRREPQANIGIATGGGHFVVDLDGAEAKGAWINMCGRHGAPERTLTVKTARGFHLFFSSRLEIPKTASRLAPHVDVRGDGGYVVAAPSIHPSGAVYTIARDLSIAPAPRWLVDLAMPDERPEQLPEPMSARRMTPLLADRARRPHAGCRPVCYPPRYPVSRQTVQRVDIARIASLVAVRLTLVHCLREQSVPARPRKGG